MTTTTYQNAICTTYYTGTNAAETFSCEVRLTDAGEIVVRYEDEGSHTVYEGEEDGSGHYLLECAAPARRASLHRFNDSLILEGFWEESGSRGMWRISLGEVEDDVTGRNGEPKAPDTGIEQTNHSRKRDTADEIEEEEEDDDDGWTSIPVFYRFPLREDWFVHLKLPNDLTQKEGKRLSRFVKSLACSY